MNADDLLVQDSITDDKYQEKRESILRIVSSGKSKMYFGTEISIEQINQLSCQDILVLHHRYENIVAGQMVKSLGYSLINMYTKVVSSIVSLDSEEELTEDLRRDPLIWRSLSEFSRCLFFKFGSMLAPLCAGLITINHLNFDSIKNGIFTGHNESNPTTEGAAEGAADGSDGDKN